MKITFSEIGWIHSPFHRIEGMPIQPSGAKDVEGTVEVDAMYVAGLFLMCFRYLLLGGWGKNSSKQKHLNPTVDLIPTTDPSCY